MKPKTTLRTFLLGCSSLLAASSLHAADGSWSADADGTWTDIANWNSGAGPIANGADFTATFGNVITANRVVTLGSDRTIGNIIASDTTHNYTISGANILTLDRTDATKPTVNVTQSGRVLTITSDIAGGDALLKDGAGILRLPATAYAFTNISVAGGTLDFSNATNDSVNRTLGGGNFAGNIDIATGATFQFWRNTGDQQFSGVISGGGNVRLAYRGNYTLSGANTYTGKTTVHGEFNGSLATLNVSSFNSVTSGSMETGMGTVATPFASSSLGVPDGAANGTVDVGRTAMQASAILNYTGLGETTDRVINLVASGNSQRKGVNNLGTGTLTFTKPWTGVAGVHNNIIPITTNADMVLSGSVPDHFVSLEKRGNAKLSLSGPCTIWNNVHLYAGTLEIDSEINDGGVYSGAITTGSGNGGTNFIAVPAGTPIAVGMTIVHPRFTAGTTITAIVDINATPVEAQVSSNSDTTLRTETGYIGFKGALGIISPTPTTNVGLRWVNSATLKYDGPTDSTNRGFLIDAGDTATWEIIGGSTLEVSGATTNTSGGITKTGAGALVLSGDLLNTGITTVSAGKLFIDGDSSAATGAVSVVGNATLGGTGTIGGDTTIDDTGKLEFDLSTGPGSHDKLDLAAGKTLTFASTSTLTITSGGGATTGLYTLVTAPGALSISGAVPASVNLPVGWTADAPQIVPDGPNTSLQINITSTGGGGSAYSTWASTNATSGDPDDDFDGDGVSNAVEFVLGGLASTNDLGKLPAAATSGANMTFTFVRDQDSVDGTTLVTIEVGNSLVTWPSTFSVGANTGSSSVGVVVTDNLNGTDTVVLTVTQAPDAKKFARLKAVVTP